MCYTCFFSVNPCLIDRFNFNHTFLLNMLYDYISIYEIYKTEGKKERKKDI